jgi:hypothetical protein
MKNRTYTYQQTIEKLKELIRIIEIANVGSNMYFNWLVAKLCRIRHCQKVNEEDFEDLL